MPFSPNQVADRLRATGAAIGCVIDPPDTPPDDSLGCGTPPEGSLGGSAMDTARV
jgi:hypothetical protein